MLQIDAEPPVEVCKVWYSRPGRPPLPTTDLLADQTLACILPEGHDWSLLVPITALFVPRIQTNTLVDWVHTYASVTNQSACWVCTEIPLNASSSLPWHISPASVSNWTWLQHQWNSSHPLWNVTWTDIDSGVKQWYDRPRPLVDYSTWDGSGGLTVEANVAGPWSWIAPLCIENLKGQVWVCRTLTGLCQTPTLKHAWEV